MPQKNKNIPGETILIGDESLLALFPEITNDTPSLSTSILSGTANPAVVTARFLPSRTYAGANEPFINLQSAFIDSGVLVPTGINTYTFGELTRLQATLRYDLHSLSTANTLDLESIICGATTASQAVVSWVYVAVSGGTALDTKVWSSLTADLRKTGSRLCVVDLYQWRANLKSTSSHRVKI